MIKMQTGMKIKIFEDTDVDAYVDYIEECGYECHVKSGYILIGDRKCGFSIDREKLGKILESTRKKKRISREKMSQIVGISESLLFYIEHGMASVKEERIHKLCEVLGLDKEQLLESCRKG